MMRQRLGVIAVAALALVVVPVAVAPAAATESVSASRVAGADRHATAAAVARASFPDGATSAVLARSDEFPDALAGSFLAGTVGGPVLLTAADRLSVAARDALEDLGVNRVHVLGGTGAVSASIARDLEADGYDVERIAGATRYETAAKLALAGGDMVDELDGIRTALVASGADFPDALAAGPLSFAAGLPILLTPPDSLSPDTADALADLDIGHVVVLGGSAAVSDDVVAAIEQRGLTTERLAGDNRVATAAAVADFAIARLGWNGAAVTLARSDAFPDGLAGGPLGGTTQAPILLTEPEALSSETAAWLTAHADTAESITALGGSAAVSDSALDEARVAAGGFASTALVATGDPALAGIGSTRTCTVVAPAGATVELRLLPSANVTAPTDTGALAFADEPADGVADEGAPRAVITSVDGRTQSPASARVDGVDSDGAIDVAVQSSEYDSVTLVAFIDGEGGTPRALDVDARGAPTEEASAGCRTVFAPPEAASGTHASVVVGTVVDVVEQLFIDDAGRRTFRFDDGDTYTLADNAISQTDFEARLSQSDVLEIDYAPGGASVFTIRTDSVLPAKTPVGIATASDVEVAFEVPASNGHGTTYRIDRNRTHPDADRCTSQIAGTATAVGVTSTSPFDDIGVPDGCYIYRIVTVASNGLTKLSAFSAPVKVPGAPAAADTVRPRSTYATVSTDSAPTGSLGAGDTITIVFDEPMAAPAAGASVTVTSGGTSATFTAGSGSSFSLNSAAVTVGGVERSASTVLTIAITANPTTPVPLPATITNHGGIADLAGNLWDIAASDGTNGDRTLEAPA